MVGHTLADLVSLSLSNNSTKRSARENHLLVSWPFRLVNLIPIHVSTSLSLLSSSSSTSSTIVSTVSIFLKRVFLITYFEALKLFSSHSYDSPVKSVYVEHGCSDRDLILRPRIPYNYGVFLRHSIKDLFFSSRKMYKMFIKFVQQINLRR